MQDQDYHLKFYEDFQFPPDVVYRNIIDLENIHVWNAGMMAVEGPSVMKEGLIYTAKSVSTGQMSISTMTVTKLVPNKQIDLQNDSGLIVYNASICLEPLNGDSTRVWCAMDFSLASNVLEDARSVVEEMAKARILGNWEVLKQFIAAHQTVS